MFVAGVLCRYQRDVDSETRRQCDVWYDATDVAIALEVLRRWMPDERWEARAVLLSYQDPPIATIMLRDTHGCYYPFSRGLLRLSTAPVVTDLHALRLPWVEPCRSILMEIATKIQRECWWDEVDALQSYYTGARALFANMDAARADRLLVVE